jgi:hypothetical protein
LSADNTCYEFEQGTSLLFSQMLPFAPGNKPFLCNEEEKRSHGKVDGVHREKNSLCEAWHTGSAISVAHVITNFKQVHKRSYDRYPGHLGTLGRSPGYQETR